MNPITAQTNVYDIKPYDNITPHFIWREVIHSDNGERAGILNIPPQDLLPAIFHTAERMELVRTKLLHPIIVTSWYRNLAVNALAASHYSSQHIRGEAVDWYCPWYGDPVTIALRLFSFIEELQIDQLILEYSWIHTSFCSNPNSKPRGQVLTLKPGGGYYSGITDKFGRLL